MAQVEIFLNRGMTLYEGRLANFNRIAFEYESKHTEPKEALAEAYRVVNYPNFELNDEEAQIQEEYLASNVELLNIGDIIAVDDMPWVYTVSGMKKL